MEMLWEGEEEEAGMMLDEAPSAPSASMLELEEDAILPEAEGVDITPGAVLKKIETLVGSLLAALVEPTPTVPPLKLQTSAATTLERRLLNVHEAPQCVRLWRVLAEAHSNITAGRTVTQRELYYTLSDGVTVRRAAEVNAAIADATRLLGVPRAALGVTTAARGSVAGMLAIKEGNVWSDLSTGPGRSIPGNLDWIAACTLRSTARHILVVEKDAVFNRLLQEDTCRRLDAIMLTARGQPDVASRALLSKLAALLPEATVAGLVDYNPSGALILGTYRGTQLANARTAQEARFGVDVRWLCARSGDLAESAALIPLTPRDRVLLANLLARLGDTPSQAGIVLELRAMAARGMKAELEALYDSTSDLTPILQRKLLRADFA